MNIKKVLGPTWCKILVFIFFGLILGKTTLKPIELYYGMDIVGRFPPARNLVLGFPTIMVNQYALSEARSICTKKYPWGECGFGGTNINDAPIQYKIAAYLTLFAYWYVLSIIICLILSPIRTQINKLNPSTRKIVYYIIIGLVLAGILYLGINQIYATT